MIMSKLNPYLEATDILVSEDCPRYTQEYKDVMAVLEDTTSPIGRKFQEKLYQSILEKGHIDFGDIPTSKGDIRKYGGYVNMRETIKAIKGLAETQKEPEVLKYADIVDTAITYIEGLTPAYTKGFSSKNEYVMMEYCTYTYTCVQATTAILYEFVDYIKRPDKGTITISLKNTKGRADKFYFEQLQKFNAINKNMGIEYRKILEKSAEKGKAYFAGIDDAFLIGLGALAAVAIAIVPVTRSLIYHIYKLRGNLSNSLALQAHFLEMNKTCVEANEAFTKEKKGKILKKQESMRKNLQRMSDILKVKTTKGRREAQKELDSDNKSLTLQSVRKDVEDSPLELI